MNSYITFLLGFATVVLSVPTQEIRNRGSYCTQDTLKNSILITSPTNDGVHDFFEEKKPDRRFVGKEWPAQGLTPIEKQSLHLSANATKRQERTLNFEFNKNNTTPVAQLPPVNQFVTTHDPKTGKAIFSNAIPQDVATDISDPSMRFTLLYVTETFPVDMRNDTDLAMNAKYRKEQPSLTNEKGTILRYVDFAPGNASVAVMHRTVSLDYAVIIEGEVDLILDSGETRSMKRGDVAIQRGTMHAWKNVSPDKWCRILFVLQASKQLEIMGTKYEEAVSGIVR